MINKNLIGRKIQQCRINKKVTQEELAEAVNISANYLSKVERCLNMPGADVLLKIIEYLDMDLKDFEIFKNEKKNNNRNIAEILISNCNNQQLKIIIPVIKAIMDASK